MLRQLQLRTRKGHQGHTLSVPRYRRIFWCSSWLSSAISCRKWKHVAKVRWISNLLLSDQWDIYCRSYMKLPYPLKLLYAFLCLTSLIKKWNFLDSKEVPISTFSKTIHQQRHNVKLSNWFKFNKHKQPVRLTLKWLHTQRHMILVLEVDPSAKTWYPQAYENSQSTCYASIYAFP